MKLFVGLGNPGQKYAGNRHNIGFFAVERIAADNGFGPWKSKFQGKAAEGDLGGERVVLLKPETYMNESGRAVQEAARFLKIDDADIVVFHDELDLAPGKVRVKVGGGNAGHNGLRSISAHRSNDYVRVRLGIGHPGHKDLVHNWVLGDFAKADRQWLDELLDAVARSAAFLAKGENERFMSDVARLTGDASAPVKKDAGAAEKSPKADSPAPAKPKPSGGHPAGERMKKQQNALAENLKAWMAAKQRKDGE